MKQYHAVPDSDRRSFLKGVVAAGVADDTTGTALRKSEVSASRGYHETDHIRDYYRTRRT